MFWLIDLIGVVYSLKDPAGRGIAEYILKTLGEEKLTKCDYSTPCYRGWNFILTGFEEDVLYFDFLDEVLPVETDFYLVLSRHSSEARVKSYTVHATGNYSNTALAGGKPRELGFSHPQVMWFLLRGLYRVAHTEQEKRDYEVSYEATHHGPTSLAKPIVFIEIGSTEEEWSNRENHGVVGRVVIELLNKYPELPPCKRVIGIGGGHYPRKHTELALSENVCFGHIAPKYALDYLDREMLSQMVSKTRGGVEEVVVEKKGTRREHRELIEEFANSTSLKIRYI